MRFKSQGTVVEIKGEPKLSRTLVSAQTFLKLPEIEEASSLWVLEPDQSAEGDQWQGSFVVSHADGNLYVYEKASVNHQERNLFYGSFMMIFLMMS